jgi:hypothetical protein
MLIKYIKEKGIVILIEQYYEFNIYDVFKTLDDYKSRIYYKDQNKMIKIGDSYHFNIYILTNNSFIVLFCVCNFMDHYIINMYTTNFVNNKKKYEEILKESINLCGNVFHAKYNNMFCNSIRVNKKMLLNDIYEILQKTNIELYNIKLSTHFTKHLNDKDNDNIYIFNKIIICKFQEIFSKKINKNMVINIKPFSEKLSSMKVNIYTHNFA